MNKTGNRSLVLKAQNLNATLNERHEAFSGLVRAFQDMAYACAYSKLGAEKFVGAADLLRERRERVLHYD